MKTLYIKSLLLTTFLFIFLSCEDLVDAVFEFYLEQEFVVDSSTKDFDKNYIIDATDQSSNIQEYSDNIKEIEILDVKYRLTSFNGPDGQKINTAKLTVSDTGGAGAEEIATVTDEDLQFLLTNEKTLIPNQAGINRFAALIKAPPHQAMLNLAGDANEAPLDFTVLFRFRIKMTASPL